MKTLAVMFKEMDIEFIGMPIGRMQFDNFNNKEWYAILAVGRMQNKKGIDALGEDYFYTLETLCNSSETTILLHDTVPITKEDFPHKDFIFAVKLINLENKTLEELLNELKV